MSSSTETADLLRVIGAVPAEYVHRDRRVEPSDPLIVQTGLFKWYNVFDAADPVRSDLEDSSRSEATAFLDSGMAEAEYGMGVVVFHHSTAHDFLLIGSWRGHQEYWQSSLIRAANSNGSWLANEQGAISPVACVWEMAPIWHERNAWVAYLISARTVQDRQFWLDDTLTATM